MSALFVVWAACGSGGGSATTAPATAAASAAPQPPATVAPAPASAATIPSGPERAIVVPADAGVPHDPPRPLGGSAPLPEKLGRRIRNELRQKLGARVALPASVHLPAHDGGGVIYAVYEMSRFEACVGRGGDRQACREHEVEMGNACTDRGLVRVEYGPTPEGQPADRGGALTISEPKPLEGRCVLAHVLELWHGDADGDGEGEIRVDLVTRDAAREMRSGYATEAVERDLGVYREDFQPQIEIELANWLGGTLPDATGDATAARIEWRDVNGDAHADLVVETRSYDPHCNTPGDDGWIDPRRDTCEGNDLGELQTRQILFDPARDEWLVPS